MFCSQRKISLTRTLAKGWRYLAMAGLFVLPEAGLVWSQQTTVVVQQPQPSTVVVTSPAPAYGYGAASYAGSVRRESRRVSRRTSRRVAHRH
jgi:hypothetical protein